jgi:hypothetical protein
MNRSLRAASAVERLLPADRLSAAGEAIRRLGEIYAYRSAEQLSEIEYLFHPEQEPILPLDAFDRYVRQSMIVDLEQFIEAPELPEYQREYNLTMVREKSKAEILASKYLSKINYIFTTKFYEDIFHSIN